MLPTELLTRVFRYVADVGTIVNLLCASRSVYQIMCNAVYRLNGPIRASRLHYFPRLRHVRTLVITSDYDLDAYRSSALTITYDLLQMASSYASLILGEFTVPYMVSSIGKTLTLTTDLSTGFVGGESRAMVYPGPITILATDNVSYYRQLSVYSDAKFYTINSHASGLISLDPKRIPYRMVGSPWEFLQGPLGYANPLSKRDHTSLRVGSVYNYGMLYHIIIIRHILLYCTSGQLAGPRWAEVLVDRPLANALGLPEGTRLSHTALQDHLDRQALHDATAHRPWHFTPEFLINERAVHTTAQVYHKAAAQRRSPYLPLLSN